MKKETGGPAFPIFNAAGQCAVFSGITMRDWFAGMALQGLLSRGAPHTVCASTAYARADDMIAERSK